MVQPGDTLLKVSMMYRVRSTELANVNNIFGETIWANQVKILLNDDVITLFVLLLGLESPATSTTD